MENSKIEGGNALIQSTTSHGNEEKDSSTDLNSFGSELDFLIGVLRAIKAKLNDKRT